MTARRLSTSTCAARFSASSEARRGPVATVQIGGVGLGGGSTFFGGGGFRPRTIGGGGAASTSASAPASSASFSSAGGGPLLSEFAAVSTTFTTRLFRAFAQRSAHRSEFDEAVVADVWTTSPL